MLPWGPSFGGFTYTHAALPGLAMQAVALQTHLANYAQLACVALQNCFGMQQLVPLSVEEYWSSPQQRGIVWYGYHPLCHICTMFTV